MEATLINASSAQTSIAIWAEMQQAPDTSTLAWFSAVLPSDAYTTFVWQNQYEYLWSATGDLRSGETVEAAQRLPIDGSTAALLDCVEGRYRLTARPSSPDASGPTMLIETSDTVQTGAVAIGVNLRIVQGFGLPGNGISVTDAVPSTQFVWQPVKSFFAVFGAIVQSEYNAPVIAQQTPLALDVSTDTISVMLNATNTLVQLDNTEAAAVQTSGRFRRIEPDGS